jgi:GT2 family glycosyltransferase
MIKIAIGIPSRGQVHLDWSLNFAHIIKATRYPIQVFVSRHYCIDRARQQLVDVAREQKCTHLFFIDTDIIPTIFKDNQFIPFPEVINEMINYNYPVVSAVYLSKKDFKPAIYEYTNDKLPFKLKEIDFEEIKNKTFFVDGIGLGCCLIDMKVFDILEKNGFYPFFEYVTDYKNKIEYSEDLDFCLKLLKCGIKIMCVPIYAKHIAAVNLLPNKTIEYAPISD